MCHAGCSLDLGGLGKIPARCALCAFIHPTSFPSSIASCLNIGWWIGCEPSCLTPALPATDSQYGMNDRKPYVDHGKDVHACIHVYIYIHTHCVYIYIVYPYIGDTSTCLDTAKKTSAMTRLTFPLCRQRGALGHPYWIYSFCRRESWDGITTIETQIQTLKV